jgi:hypothetical protein
MRIIRHRRTRHFVALLVGCRCGRRFLHRLDRPVVACFRCGRVRELSRLVERLRVGRQGEGRAPRAALRTRRVA